MQTLIRAAKPSHTAGTLCEIKNQNFEDRNAAIHGGLKIYKNVLDK
jgi:hypothetical protein